MIYFRPWGLFYGTRNMCRLTTIYIRILVRREWVKAREQERKEIEALHRWEEAHIFEGGGNILHNPARSCFQLWPIIGDEGNKIWKNNWRVDGQDKLLDNSFHRNNLKVSAASYCTCQLVLAISCKNLTKSAKSQTKEETFQSPICSPKLESG